MANDATPSPGATPSPSDLRKIVSAALDDAERTGMARPVTDEWVAIRVLAFLGREA